MCVCACVRERERFLVTQAGSHEDVTNVPKRETLLTTSYYFRIDLFSVRKSVRERRSETTSSMYHVVQYVASPPFIDFTKSKVLQKRNPKAPGGAVS